LKGDKNSDNIIHSYYILLCCWMISMVQLKFNCEFDAIIVYILMFWYILMNS
jgi:hypothetical protein